MHKSKKKLLTSGVFSIFNDSLYGVNTKPTAEILLCDAGFNDESKLYLYIPLYQTGKIYLDRMPTHSDPYVLDVIEDETYYNANGEIK